MARRIYERLCLVTVDKIIPHVGEKENITISGVRICLNSLQLLSLKQNGTNCSHCSLDGKYFAIERLVSSGKRVFDRYFVWHLNLYGRNEDGEILITCDHVKPRSKGGEDDLHNTQTLCHPCNQKKGNEYD